MNRLWWVSWLSSKRLVNNPTLLLKTINRTCFSRHFWKTMVVQATIILIQIERTLTTLVNQCSHRRVRIQIEILSWWFRVSKDNNKTPTIINQTLLLSNQTLMKCCSHINSHTRAQLILLKEQPRVDN